MDRIRPEDKASDCLVLNSEKRPQKVRNPPKSDTAVRNQIRETFGPTLPASHSQQHEGRTHRGNNQLVSGALGLATALKTTSKAHKKTELATAVRFTHRTQYGNKVSDDWWAERPPSAAENRKALLMLESKRLYTDKGTQLNPIVMLTALESTAALTLLARRILRANATATALFTKTYRFHCEVRDDAGDNAWQVVASALTSDIGDAIRGLRAKINNV